MLTIRIHVCRTFQCQDFAHCIVLLCIWNVRFGWDRSRNHLTRIWVCVRCVCGCACKWDSFVIQCTLFSSAPKSFENVHNWFGSALTNACSIFRPKVIRADSEQEICANAIRVYAFQSTIVCLHTFEQWQSNAPRPISAEPQRHALIKKN